MSELAACVLPLEDKFDTFSILEVSASGKYLVGVRRHVAPNIIHVYGDEIF